MKTTKPIHTLTPSQKASGRVDHSANEPLSFWERGWGEGENGTFLPLGILKSYKKPRNHHDQMTCPQPLASAADSHRTANHRVRLGAPLPEQSPPLQSGRGLGRGCKKPAQRQKQNDIRLGTPLPATAASHPAPLQSQTSSHTAATKTLRIPAQNAARKLRYLACLLTLAALPARAAEYIWLYDGERPIHAEVVYRDEDRARGLMYRPWLAPYSGMLFIFDPPQAVAFWMKNTLIPLEMRFYDVRGERITRHLARPCSKPPCAHYPARGQTAYVLETRARYRLVAPPYPLQFLPALPQ